VQGDPAWACGSSTPSTSTSCSPRPPPGLRHPLAFGAAGEAEGEPSGSFDWCIQSIFHKLKTSCGCALVSPSTLQIDKCANIRLLFAPGQVWSTNSRRGRKSNTAKHREGEMNEPINGALKLKLDGSGESVRLEFYLFVGLARQGPFVCDFENQSQ